MLDWPAGAEGARLDPALIVSRACALIAEGDLGEAPRTLGKYPSQRASTPRSTWPRARLLRVFQRDRFADRYSGEALVVPGTLRALAVLVPKQFPYQRNWKQAETHPAFRELSPAVDHVVPLALGGLDEESNAVTTSSPSNLSTRGCCSRTWSTRRSSSSGRRRSGRGGVEPVVDEGAERAAAGRGARGVRVEPRLGRLTCAHRRPQRSPGGPAVLAVAAGSGAHKAPAPRGGRRARSPRCAEAGCLESAGAARGPAASRAGLPRLGARRVACGPRLRANGARLPDLDPQDRR